MTKAQAIDLIADRLGNRQAMDGRIERELDASQELFESGPFRPWFLVKTSSTLASGQNVSLPADFLGPIEDMELVVVGETGKPVRSAWEWQLSPELRLSSPGEPRWYVLGVGSLSLYPPPAEPRTLILTYYAREPLVSSLPPGGSNGWLRNAGLVLVNHAGAKVAAHLRAPEVAQLFDLHYREAFQQLLNADAAWRSNSKIFLLGG